MARAYTLPALVGLGSNQVRTLIYKERSTARTEDVCAGVGQGTKTCKMARPAIHAPWNNTDEARLCHVTRR